MLSLAAMLCLPVAPATAATTGAGTFSNTANVPNLTPVTSVSWSFTISTGEKITALSLSANRDSGSGVVVQARCGEDWGTSSAGILTGPMWNLSDGSPVTGGTSACSSPNLPVTGLRIWYGGTLLTTATTLLYEWTTALDRPASSCASSYLDARAGYVGTTLTAVVKWAGVAPAGGWVVKAPGTGYTWATAPTGTLSVGTTATTTPGEYSASGSVSGLTAGTTVRVEKASDPTCYTLAVMGGSAVSTGPSNNGQDETGADCGINIFCAFSAALRWAFVPSEEAKGNLAETFDGVYEKFPFGLVETFADYGTLITGCAESRNGVTGDGCQRVSLSYTLPATDAGGYEQPGETFWIANEAAPHLEPGFMAGIANVRGILTTMVWVAFIGSIAWVVFRWATPFGVLGEWGVSGRKSGDD